MNKKPHDLPVKKDLDFALESGIVHDASNMLCGVIGNLQFIKSSRDLKISHENLEKLNAAINGCSHIASLLREWKAQANPNIPAEEPQPFSLEEVVLGAKSLLAPLIPERIIFKCEINAEGTIRGKRHQIEQVILNLVKNAVQSIPAGGTITLILSSSGNTSSDFLELKLQDSGKGIPVDAIHNIFLPYYSSKRDRGGIGIGLAMVKKIIENHGGQISVQSKVNVGTTFTITLPRIALNKRSDKAVTQPLVDRKPTIMVIDDTVPLLEIMRDFIEENDMHAATFEDGEQALTWLASENPAVDLIILDLHMPIISGQECFFRLKKLLPNTPVAICSGTLEEELDDTLSQEAVRFLQKPLNYEATIDWIRDYLRAL